MRLGLVIVIAASLASAACRADPGPLPYVPTPQEAAAAAAKAEAASRWRSTVNLFFETIRPTVGDAPVECSGEVRHNRLPRAGHVPQASLRRWFDCTRTAAAAGKASIIVLKQASVDSWTLSGTLVSSDGSATAFFYDAMLGADRPDFWLGRCASPTPRASGTGVYGIRCANERRDGRVPMSEQP